MSSIKKNYLYNASFQIIMLIVPFITTPYITRILSKDGIGEYSYNNSVASYFIIFIMLGINNYGNREIAKNRNDLNELGKTFFSIYFLQLIWGIFIFCIYICYAFCFSDNVRISMIFGIMILGAVIDINWALNGLEKFKMASIRNVAVKIISTFCIFCFIKNGNDIHKYCFIMAISNFISQIISWPILLKNIKFVRISVRDIIVHIRPNLLFFSTVLSISVFKIMDKIMLGILSNNVEVGLYELSERIVQIPMLLIVSLGNVMLPRITSLLKKGELNFDYYITNSMVFSMFVSSVICFGIMSISKDFVPFYYGEGYEKCVFLYYIMLPSCIFMAFANVLRNQYMLPKQLDKPFMISGFLGAGVNIIANLILIPLNMSIGAAIGTLISEIVICLYQTKSVNKAGLDIKKYIKISFLFIISGIEMFVLLININFGNAGYLFSILCKSLMGLILYGLFLKCNLYCIVHLLKDDEIKNILLSLKKSKIVKNRRKQMDEYS